MTGTRDGAIGRAEKYFDEGGFLSDLQRRVAIPTLDDLFRAPGGVRGRRVQILNNGRRVHVFACTL